MGKDTSQKGAMELIRETFFDLTLCLEAIFLIHKADEELVEAIMRNIEQIYQNATNDITRGGCQRAYPAIDRFLCRLSRGRYVPQGKAR